MESWAVAEAGYALEYTCWEQGNTILLLTATVTNHSFFLLFGGVWLPPTQTAPCGRLSRVAFLWTRFLYPSVGAVMNFCRVRLVCEGPRSSGADNSPSDRPTNPLWTQPAPRISTNGQNTCQYCCLNVPPEFLVFPLRGTLLDTVLP